MNIVDKNKEIKLRHEHLLFRYVKECFLKTQFIGY